MFRHPHDSLSFLVHSALLVDRRFVISEEKIVFRGSISHLELSVNRALETALETLPLATLKEILLLSEYHAMGLDACEMKNNNTSSHYTDNPPLRGNHQIISR